MRIPCDCLIDRSCHGKMPGGSQEFPSWRACPGHPRLWHARKESKTWMPGTSSAKTRFALLPGHGDRKSGAPGRQTTSPSAVDLPTHDRDRLLIDLRRVPGLDRREIRFARLITGAGPPAMGFEEIRG